MSSHNDSDSHQGIVASLNYLNESDGKLSVPSETTLFDLLSKCFADFAKIYYLKDQNNILSAPSTLERVMCSIFDTSSLAYVTARSLHMMSGLDDQRKLTLFVQAVAGISVIFQRLSAFQAGINQGVLSGVLQLFAENQQRHEMLDEIESSGLLTSSYSKSEIADYLVDIIEENIDDDGREVPVAAPEKIPIDINGDEWTSSRPCKKMGLPWGFTIMTLN